MLQLQEQAAATVLESENKNNSASVTYLTCSRFSLDVDSAAGVTLVGPVTDCQTFLTGHGLRRFILLLTSASSLLWQSGPRVLHLIVNFLDDEVK